MTTTIAAPVARAIDLRYRPPVGGVDLMQALNYITVDDTSVDFCYNRYTASRLAYKAGSRPELERISQKVTAGCTGPIDIAQALNSFVAKEVAWAGFFEKRTGKALVPNQALTEEQLITQRAGWCNEQARVLCCLTQVLGIPSRIVFAGNRAMKYGHCITEVLLPEGWLMLDQSFGYAFMKDGKPVRAYDVFNEPSCRAYFAPIYKKMCDDLKIELGADILSHAFAMSMAPVPLDGFEAIGFHNHFVL
jgi:transglutaminase-like putative cysteine protease